MTIRVLICDDQEVVREGLRVILTSTAGIEVVGLAHDGAEALALVSQTQPNLVRNYVSAVLTKLGVSERAQAAILGLWYGLVDLNEI